MKTSKSARICDRGARILFSDGSDDSQKARDLLLAEGVEFSIWDVNDNCVTGMDSPPPVLMTGQGRFIGVRMIAAYSKLPAKLTRPLA